MIRLVCDKSQTLKQFTDMNCAQASFYFSTLLRNKDIKVNGKKTSVDMLLCEGDEVCYYLTAKQEEKSAYTLVYEDENILIVDKESGVNSEAVFAQLLRNAGGMCYFIHRLDRNTQGLMAFALNEKTERALLSAFKERRVEKRYHALCVGTFPQREEVLTAYLKKDAERAQVKVFDVPKNGAEQIVTEYRVLSVKDGFTKVEVTLHTGKTHQIRAHLAHIGCPILGDMKYGNTVINKAKKAARQCLVAKYLLFTADGVLSYLKGKEFISRFDAEMPTEGV